MEPDFLFLRILDSAEILPTPSSPLTGVVGLSWLAFFYLTLLLVVEFIKPKRRYTSGRRCDLSCCRVYNGNCASLLEISRSSDGP
jgi:hypothetical protein